MKYRSSSNLYINGNYIVKTARYGSSFFGLWKRALRIGEDLKSEFPDSIDLKISNRCSHGCPFCHESSIKNGKILDLDKTKEILSQLPTKPIEIAVGGGNVLECLDETEDILDWLNKRGHQTRITITFNDLKSTGSKKLDEKITNILYGVGGLGISITSLKSTGIDLSIFEKNGNFFPFKGDLLNYTDLGKNLSLGPQIVYHVIAGITPLDDIKWLIKNTKSSILILGFKQWGRSKDSDIPDLSKLKEYLKDLIQSPENSNLSTIGFDNLAIEQLDIKNIIGDNSWKEIYLGDEGSCSMYIDAVKGEFARTSRSPERISWDNIKLLDYYASLSTKREI